MKRLRLPEKAVQQQIVHLLRSLGAHVYEIGTRRRRQDYPGTMQSPGIPDLVAFLPPPVLAPDGIDAGIPGFTEGVNSDPRVIRELADQVRREAEDPTTAPYEDLCTAARCLDGYAAVIARGFCGAAAPRQVWIEVKAAGGKLRPAQAVFRDDCWSTRVAHLVGDVDVVIRFLIAGGWLKPENLPHYRRPALSERKNSDA